MPLQIMENTTRKHLLQSQSSTRTAKFWYAAYVIVAVAIVAGNILTIAIFMRKKRKNFLLISLAVADLFIGLLAVPMYIYLLHRSLYEPAWKDDLFNHIYITVDVFVGLASVFALTLIAAERAYAIFWPFRYRCIASKTYWTLIGVSWTLAGLLSSFDLLALRDLLPKKFANYCLIITVLVSLCVIVAVYISLGLKISKVKRRHSIYEFLSEEKSISLALLIVTLVFLVTWLPFYILIVIGSFNRSFLQQVPSELIYAAKLLHYGNSFMNPIIYSLKLPEFRETLKKLLCKRRVLETNV